ncbi:MAG: DUF1667 domain-containing protein [Chitinispirillaceae bacterium]|nr:DUF1667 domain-containing protein [Chitinispirillaceae bacterium]
MELICIVCPNGCHLTVNQTPAGIAVTGNKCNRGEQYGRDELIDPRRTVTAVVRTTDFKHPCVPVKSDRPIAKPLINEVLRKIYSLHIDLPVKRGDICIDNCCNSGAAICYSRSLFPSSTERQA